MAVVSPTSQTPEVEEQKAEEEVAPVNDDASGETTKGSSADKSTENDDKSTKKNPLSESVVADGDDFNAAAAAAASLSMAVEAPTRKRRRSLRNTNRLSLPHPSSLQYRRLAELFFDEPSSRGNRSRRNAPPPPKGLERLHTSPNIYRVPHFLTATELAHFQKKIATTRFQKSYVDQVPTNSNNNDDRKNGDNTTTSAIYDTEHRTSMFDSFQKAQDQIIAGVERKAADLLGCWSPETCLEPLQLVRYQEGQFFGVHHDLGAYDEETSQVELPPKSLLGIKRRIATLFVYLNEPRAGGDTWFPAAGNLTVAPAAGSAVLFGNVVPEGLPDARTVHSGRAVTQGVKYGLNIWYLES